MSEYGRLQHDVALEQDFEDLGSGAEIRLLPRRRTRYERLVKPTMDRLLAGVVLVLVSPVMAAVALSVAATLGRPLLYRQQRVGLDGQPFDMLKFRTMLPDRRRNPQHLKWEKGPERRFTHKSAHDPRHVPLGRFLRRFSLDELPQLWNVVRGDMSLIGPRPELVHVVASYEPWQHARHKVKPGITGLWQITDRANGDLMLHHTDPDLRILVLTIPAALRRQGG